LILILSKQVEIYIGDIKLLAYMILDEMCRKYIYHKNEVERLGIRAKFAMR